MNIERNWMNFAYMDNPTVDGSGNAFQHLHYIPFGEDWVDQRNSSWNTPYNFSGKEKDVETGYGYFGARYYDSGLSIWLSVDPMSDKYPSMSPYNYCANNPVILVDPDGREVEKWKPVGKGGWTAEAGDSPGSLARDANISQAEAEAAIRAANKQRGQPRTSETMVYEGDHVVIPSQQTKTSKSSSNGNKQNNESRAHSVTIGGVLSITRGLSLDIGPIWDKDGGGLLICFGVCRGLDLSGGLTYSNCNSMDAAEGKGEALVSSISLVDDGLIPYVGWLLGVSLSPLPAGFTLRKTYTLILKPDPAEYGENISKCGHPIR